MQYGLRGSPRFHGIQDRQGPLEQIVPSKKVQLSVMGRTPIERYIFFKLEMIKSYIFNNTLYR